MSAYVELTVEDLAALCRLVGADRIVACAPITAGIENSNWRIDFAQDSVTLACVLSRIEAVEADELPFFIALTDTLAAAELPVPVALGLADGRRQFMLRGRPALLVPRLPGAHVTVPEKEDCAAAGETLARLHRAASGCSLRRDRPDHRWWPVAFAWVAPLIDHDVHDELAAALLEGTRLFVSARHLPHGIIHGDYFRDNVLLRDGTVSGVLDFFHATVDVLVWDVAIALNDWAIRDGIPDPALADAFLAAYSRQRTLTRDEEALLPGLRRAAAARFWLSRLVFAEKQRELSGDAIQRKDPGPMRALLRALGS